MTPTTIAAPSGRRKRPLDDQRPRRLLMSNLLHNHLPRNCLDKFVFCLGWPYEEISSTQPTSRGRIFHAAPKVGPAVASVAKTDFALLGSPCWLQVALKSTTPPEVPPRLHRIGTRPHHQRLWSTEDVSP